MIEDIYKNIVSNIEVRQNLSLLRKELKKEGGVYGFLYQLSGDFSVLEKLLLHDDAKTRKNTALLMGDLGDKKLLNLLYEAYEKEEILFVRSAYLTALKEFDYREYLPKLKERLEVLSKEKVTEENKKHIGEEIRALSDLVLFMGDIKPHVFTGYPMESDLILLTNRNFIRTTLNQVEKLENTKAKTFHAGVMAVSKNLEEILKIRTIEEILFAMEEVKTCPLEPEKAAERLIKGGLIQFIKARHQGKAPFYFRVECKSKMPLDKKSIFVKKLAGEIERLSKRSLINTTSSYEFEIRMIENKEGKWNVLFKLYNMEDNRFAYRKEALPTSIKPVNAALVMELLKDYLKEDAKILDPFCGTGTMLIERYKKLKTNTLYGLDIYEEAIEKAKINTKEAHQIIHYINRDFFDFTHSHLFDEVITNMPRVIGRKTEAEIEILYKEFFQKAGKHLTETGWIFLHSHNKEMVGHFCKKGGFSVKEEWELSKKEGSYVFALKRD